MNALHLPSAAFGALVVVALCLASRVIADWLHARRLPRGRPDAACLTCEGVGKVWLRKPDPSSAAPCPRLVDCTTCNGSGRVAP